MRTYSTKTCKVALTRSVLPEDGQGCGIWLSRAESDFVPMAMMALSKQLAVHLQISLLLCAVRLQLSLLLCLRTDLRAL